MDKKRKFAEIVENIKKIKIQGAASIAKSALYAYSLFPNKRAKQKLINARATEPMLANVLKNYEILGYKKTLLHFQEAQDKINKYVFQLVKNNSIIFTHCHSTNVIKSLIYAKKHGKKFQVYNTETRPLFQGRKTALELKKSGIPVTSFIDSAARTALIQAKKIKGIDLVFFGADAILKSGVINKIGSGMFAEIAYNNKIPVYIIADSWKFARHVKLEERNFKEIWETAPKNIKLKNPAFELIPKQYIKAIVSELGILALGGFVKKVKN